MKKLLEELPAIYIFWIFCFGSVLLIILVLFFSGRRFTSTVPVKRLDLA